MWTQIHVCDWWRQNGMTSLYRGSGSYTCLLSKFWRSCTLECLLGLISAKPVITECRSNCVSRYISYSLEFTTGPLKSTIMLMWPRVKQSWGKDSLFLFSGSVEQRSYLMRTGVCPIVEHLQLHFSLVYCGYSLWTNHHLPNPVVLCCDVCVCFGLFFYVILTTVRASANISRLAI